MYFLQALYFHISIQIFCNLFSYFVFDGLLQSIYFQMFCSKHSIIFDTYLLSGRFHYVDLFYINFRSCETFTVTNSGAILLSIETPSNFKNSVDLSYTYKYMFWLVYIQMFCISQLAFLRFTFHWYLHGSN